MNREQMTAPFAEEELRQFQGRGGQTMTYIEDETVMDRLDAGYGYGNWQVQVEEARAEGVVKVRLGVRESGEWTWYEDFGYANREGGETLKEAVTDGIRRCGRMVGIARDLYRKSTYEPGGSLSRKVPEKVAEGEELEILGNLRKSGIVVKGTSARYGCEFFMGPEGHVIGFKLKLDGDKDIPQVLCDGDIGEALFLATGGDSASLIGQKVMVRGRLHAVRVEKRRPYYRLVVTEITTDEWRIPALLPDATETAVAEAEHVEAAPEPLWDGLTDEEKELVGGGLPA
jgi:hypothetical protein